jgi:hypothetical protein
MLSSIIVNENLNNTPNNRKLKHSKFINNVKQHISMTSDVNIKFTEVPKPKLPSSNTKKSNLK